MKKNAMAAAALAVLKLVAGAAADNRRRALTRAGPGIRSIITVHREIAANRARNEARGRRGRYNWNNH